LNVNFLNFHVAHQTTNVYNTREVIDKYHHNHKSKMSTNISLSGCQNVNVYLTIQLLKYQRTSHYPLPTCQRTTHYQVIKMFANLALSGYQDVNQHLTIWLSKCQQTSHNPVIKISTNVSLSVYQNVHEPLTIQ
jgi:hypothetical protein